MLAVSQTNAVRAAGTFAEFTSVGKKTNTRI
jgi:hypothetical protein